MQLEKRLVKCTAGLVFVFTIALAFNLLSFRPSSVPALISSSRQPASVNENNRIFSPDFESAKDMEQKLPCLSNGGNYRLKSPTQRFRFESTVCTAKAEIVESIIVNKTTGFGATVFKLSPQNFTTDLIDLNKGDNRLHISHTLKNGEKILAELIVNY